MILVVSMEKLNRHKKTEEPLRKRLEDLTGHGVSTVHYSKVSPDLVEEHSTEAIFITGFGYSWREVSPAHMHGMSDVLHHMDIPVLGACGGHQLIGWLFNHDVRRLKSFDDTPMRKLRRGELDPFSYLGDYLGENGLHQVEIVRRDPLFKGLRSPFWVPQAHYCEIKHLPAGFVQLARNHNCELQCIRHESRSLYGTQFHPEFWKDPYLDGKTIVTNFFRIAGLVN